MHDLQCEAKNRQGYTKLGLSMSLCGKEFANDLKCLERNLTKSYLDVLRDFTRFAVDNDFSIIEMASIALIPAQLLIPIARQVEKELSRFKEVTYHLPLGEINIAALHPSIRKVAIEETKRHIDFCREIGINEVIMHPGCFAAMPDMYLLLEGETRKIAEESVLDIFDYCQRKNIMLSVENLPRQEPLFQKPEEFEFLVKKGVGMVLDTVHAFVSNVDPSNFIRQFSDRITEVHLTDGVYADPITHYPLGTGEVDCVRVLNELTEIGFQGRVILEVESKKDATISKQFLVHHSFCKPLISIL